MFHYALHCATGSGLAEPLLFAYYKADGFMFVFRERTEHLDIFLFFAYHSVVLYFRCSDYWWNRSVRFYCI